MEKVGRLEPDESGTVASTGLLLEDWAKPYTPAIDRSATTPNAGAQQQEENFITRIQIPMTSLYHCEGIAGFIPCPVRVTSRDNQLKAVGAPAPMDRVS